MRRARGRPRALLAIPAAVALLGGAARAQSVPALTAPVNDFAHVIDADAAAALDRHIRALQAATGDAVVIVTASTFEPFGSIDEYAVKLFEHAGVGEKKNDNGVLIVLTMKERKVRIEVGYGLEAFVTDGFAGDTIREYMTPAFRDGDYGGGLLAGASRVIARIAERRGVTIPDLPALASVRSQPSGISPAVGIAIVLALFALSRFFRRFGGPTSGTTSRWGGRNTWSGWHGGIGGFGGGFGRGGFGGGGFGGFGGGGGGGGFGGFGGGRSGGGGASGGW